MSQQYIPTRGWVEINESVESFQTVPRKDFQEIKLDRRIEDASETIERMVTGLINYYNQIKSQSAKGKSLNDVEELERLAAFTSRNLTQFNQF